MNHFLTHLVTRPEIVDNGRCRIGATCRIMPSAPRMAVTDLGRIRVSISRRICTIG